MSDTYDLHIKIGGVLTPERIESFGATLSDDLGIMTESAVELLEEAVSNGTGIIERFNSTWGRLQETEQLCQSEEIWMKYRSRYHRETHGNLVVVGPGFYAERPIDQHGVVVTLKDLKRARKTGTLDKFVSDSIAVTEKKIPKLTKITSAREILAHQSKNKQKT